MPAACGRRAAGTLFQNYLSDYQRVRGQSGMAGVAVTQLSSTFNVAE